MLHHPSLFNVFWRLPSLSISSHCSAFPVIVCCHTVYVCDSTGTRDDRGGDDSFGLVFLQICSRTVSTFRQLCKYIAHVSVLVIALLQPFKAWCCPDNGCHETLCFLIKLMPRFRKLDIYFSMAQEAQTILDNKIVSDFDDNAGWSTGLPFRMNRGNLKLI